MTAIPTLAFWLEGLLVLLAGGAVLVTLAALPARWAQSGVARRTLWQAATLGLAVLLATEVTGLGAGLTGWLRQRAPTAPGPVPAAEARPVPAEATVVAAPEPAAQPTPAPYPAEAETAPLPAAGAEAAVWWPGLLWLAGAALVAGRVVLARCLLVVFRRRHRPVTDERLREMVCRVAGRLGLRRWVQVLEADGLLGPVAFGILRPTVALPGRFTSTFTPAQQEVILAHELTHLAAGDPAWHLFAELVTAALWWHPLAWWSRHQLRTASELAADEASLVVADGPAVLARCLVELGGVLAGARSAGWVRMAGSGFRSGLGRRVERLVRLQGGTWRPPGRARSWLTLVLAPAALLAAAVLSTAWARARAFPEGDVPMRHAWQRSLAATVLVAALGSNADPGQAADPPATPPKNAQDTIRLEKVSGTNTQRYTATFRGGEAEEAPSQDAPADQLRKLRQELDELSKLEADIHDKREAVQKHNADLAAVSASKDELKKLADELDGVKARAADLQKRRVELEAQVQAQEQKQAEATTHVKVFRLRHQDPEEVRQVLEALLSRQAHDPGRPGMAGAGGTGFFAGARGGGRGGFGTGGGSMRPPGGGAGMMGPGSGMAPGGGNPFGSGMGGPGPGAPPGAPPGATWRLAADPRTNCLIVRGTEQDLATVADLVGMLDAPADKPPQPLKHYRLFRLRYAGAADVAQLVDRLEFNAVVVPVPNAKTVIVSGPESALKEISEVIEAVDVESAPATGGDLSAPKKP